MRRPERAPRRARPRAAAMRRPGARFARRARARTGMARRPRRRRRSRPLVSTSCNSRSNNSMRRGVTCPMARRNEIERHRRARRDEHRLSARGQDAQIGDGDERAVLAAFDGRAADGDAICAAEPRAQRRGDAPAEHVGVHGTAHEHEIENRDERRDQQDDAAQTEESDAQRRAGIRSVASASRRAAGADARAPPPRGRRRRDALGRSPELLRPNDPLAG